MKTIVSPFIFALLFLVMGCASTGKNDANKHIKSKGPNTQYLKGLSAACNIQFDDVLYCNCFARTLYDHALEHDRVGILSHKKLTALMSDNIELINKSCPRKQSTYQIPLFKPTPLLKMVLSENEGALLTPDTKISYVGFDKPTGWEYRMLPDGSKDFEKGSISRLVRIGADSLYFDHVYYTSNPPGIGAKSKYTSGISYYLSRSPDTGRYIKSDIASCKFKLQKCTYVTTGKKTVYTEFKDGMWIRNAPSIKGQRNFEIDVYDKYGFPLYHYRKNLKSGKEFEQIRMERVKEDTVEFRCRWCPEGVVD